MRVVRCPVGPCVFGAVLGLLALAGGPDALARDDSPAPSAEVADRPALLEAHNRERAASKLPPLKSNAKLDAAALEHARDMARHDKMTHEGSDESTPAQRVERQDYHYQTIGENVAAGQRSVPEVMRTWMDSPPHKKNILGDFTEIGSACVRSRDGTPYWCVDFGRPIPLLDPEEAAAGVIAGFNRERRMVKKPPLKENQTLARAARRHARDMAAHDELRQRDDDGLDPFERVKKAGYRFRRLAEANASGPPTSEEAVRSWLKQDKNREGILGEFSEVGVGYATSQKGTSYWSLILGVPAR